MPVITIPFDYDPERDRESLVPICLSDTDEDGAQIFFGWIEAVVAVQDRLRVLARRVLGDVWRVSELTEVTVHHLWRRYGDNLGPHPSHQIYKTAVRKAHGFDDPGARVHLGLNVSLDTLEDHRRDALVASDASSEDKFNIKISLQRFEEKLNEVGTAEELELYRLLRAGVPWRHIGRDLGTNWNSAYRHMTRRLRKIADIV
jgi:hypothetical protein